MSTSAEQIESIEGAVQSAKRRLNRINAMRSIGASTKSQEYERDMILELIEKGEKILGRKVTE